LVAIDWHQGIVLLHSSTSFGPREKCS
jgi:hypothetical protein